MKRKNTIPYLILVIALCLVSAISLPRTTPLKAQENSYSLKKLELILPSNVTLNALSTLDGQTFTFTNDATNFYISNNLEYDNIVFKDLDNLNLPTTNKGITLRNNLSFVYSKTEQFSNQKIIGLYKILENKQAEKDPYQTIYLNETATDYISYLSEISDLCADYYSNFYMLDINNKAILTFNYITNRIEIFKDLTNLDNNSPLNENCKMCITINGKYIFIATKTGVYKLNTFTKEIEQINVNNAINLQTITDFACDCAGNLYFLSSTSSTSTVQKQCKNNNLECLTFDKVFSEMFIEEYCGLMYYKAENEIYELIYDNFIASTTHHPAPINFNKQEFLTQPCTLAITLNSKLLLSPYALDNELSLPENSVILILQENLENEPDFAYCLFETPEKLNFGYIKKDAVKEFSNYIECENLNKKTFVITNVYKYPTRSSEKLTTITENTIVKILGTHSFTDNSILINYYCVEIQQNNNTQIGYIAQDLVYSLSSEEIEYTGGVNSPDKYSKFIEYLLIVLALIILEVVVIAIIVKKVDRKKKSDEN